MGGGYQEPDSILDHHQAVVTRLYQVCDTASYVTPDGASGYIESDYAQVEEAIKAFENGPMIVTGCAAHIELLRDIRLAAFRYKELEAEIHVLTERCCGLAEGVGGLVTPLRKALEVNAPGARAATELAVAKFKSLSKMTRAISAAHTAVNIDVKRMVALTAALMKDPSKADAGFTAAPVVGGAAMPILALAVRGPLGILAAVILAGAGALGATGAAAGVYPLIRERFGKLHEKLADVAEHVCTKADALGSLSLDLANTACELKMALEVENDGSVRSREAVGEHLASCSNFLVTNVHHCVGGRYRKTAFLALA